MKKSNIRVRDKRAAAAEKVQQLASQEMLDNILGELFVAHTIEEAWSVIKKATDSSLQ